MRRTQTAVVALALISAGCATTPTRTDRTGAETAASERRTDTSRRSTADAGGPWLRVLATNDFHGHLVPTRPSWANGASVGGAAALASYFRREGATFTQGPTIWLDGGDMMQGTALSNLTRGEAAVEFFNRAGLDGAAIGNHEFDWSPATLRERMAQAQFPWLAANMVVAGSDTTPSWVRPTAVIEREGVRIGLVGLITQETPTATMAQYVEGLAFEPGDATMDRWVPRLRAEGVDFVIVVAHAGARCVEATHTCSDEMVEWLGRTRHRPDLVVAGHTHALVHARIHGVPVIETGEWALRYGVVDLQRVSPDSVAVHTHTLRTAWTDSIAPDSAMVALVARTQTAVGPQLERVITTAAYELPRGRDDNQVGRLIADAQRAATGSQIAIMNAGGVRATIPAGTVTWGDLFSVQPFGNKLMVLRMTGARIREVLEHGVSGREPPPILSGIVAHYDSQAPTGARVLVVYLPSGEPLRDDAIYTVTVSDFLATGAGDGFAAFGQALEQQATGIVDLDALIRYIRSLPEPLRGPTDERLIRVR